MKWNDLSTEEYIIQAISKSDSNAGVPQEHFYQKSPKFTGDGRKIKHAWSNCFADEMARNFASILEGVRREPEFYPIYRNCSVAPIDKDKAEPFVALGDERKQIDVILRSDLAGLQLGLSIKGVGFPDKWNNTGPRNFGKNLTGRLYELGDETDVVHRNLPRCIMASIYLLPLEAVQDKSPSTFHSICQKMLRRTGRDNIYDSSQFRKVDYSYIGLYANRDYSSIRTLRGIPRGAVRYFSISGSLPPLEGLPRVEDTIDAHELMRTLLYARAPQSIDILPAELNP